MIDYTKKFRLDGKTAFVVGGVGLIGREVSIAFASAGANTVILDLDQAKGEALAAELVEAGFRAQYQVFDCADLKQLDDVFSGLVDEFAAPDVFINCSYPRTDDWGESSFQKVTLESFRENIDIHLNSHAWLARLAAERMKAHARPGSIIQLGSIYGLLGQDLTSRYQAPT